MYIILLGPPGSGKSTYSMKLTKEFGFHHFSVGNILRDEKYHKLVKEYIDKGAFVPLPILLNLLEESSEILYNGNVILDGIPRNIEQIDLLDNFLKKKDKEISTVIGFNIKKNLLIERALNRLICPSCKAVYNSEFIPTTIENICDVCKEKIIKREDDTKETFNIRFRNYQVQTKPLISLYKKKNLYKEFDVSKPPYDVWSKIKTFIEERL